MHRLFPASLALLVLAIAPPALAQPVSAADRVIDGVRARVIRIDLHDPATLVTLVLAQRGLTAGAQTPPAGDEPFARMAKRAGAAALVNGTFFRMDAERRIMGTMVQAGRLVNHVSFRPAGTTFGLLAGNRPVMLPAAQARWRSHWLSLSAGPRLLADGRVALAPRQEGFVDPDVLGRATRTALGYSRDGAVLYLVSVAAPISLAAEARLMRAIGCFQAMNLDGGTSRALAEGARIRVAGRALTNALAVYDARFPAPAPLAAAFRRFAGVEEHPLPLSIGGPFLDPGPFACGRRTPYHKLGAGHAWNFEGWRVLAAKGRPLVRNVDGWLELAPGGGAVALASPGGTERVGRLALLARAGDRPLSLGFGAVHLAVSQRSGLWLSLGGRPLHRWSPRAARFDQDDRHRVVLHTGAAGWWIDWDDRRLATGHERLTLAPRVVVSGAGSVKALATDERAMPLSSGR